MQKMRAQAEEGSEGVTRTRSVCEPVSDVTTEIFLHPRFTLAVRSRVYLHHKHLEHSWIPTFIKRRREL